VDNAVDPDFRSLPQVRAVEHCRSSRDEDFIFNRAPDEVCVGSNQTVAADPSRMTNGASDYGIFHDDATLAHLDSATFCYHCRAVHDAAVGANDHVPTDRCCRRDVCALIHVWYLSRVTE
jgi:hypothetical protein